MAFQSTVSLSQAFGVPGEVIFTGPTRAQPYRLSSADASYNVVGRAFTVSSEGVAQAGGAGAFAGILVHPKHYASYGTTADGTLAPTLTLANNAQVECMTLGEVVVTLPGAAAIGDAVKYNTTTGVLGVGAPGAGEATVPGAKVSHFTVSGAGLAVITLTN